MVREAVEALACRSVLPRLLLPNLEVANIGSDGLVRCEQVRRCRATPFAGVAVLTPRCATVGCERTMQILAALPPPWLAGTTVPLFLEPLERYLRAALARTDFAVGHSTATAMYGRRGVAPPGDSRRTNDPLRGWGRRGATVGWCGGRRRGRDLNRRALALLQALHSHEAAVAWAQQHGLSL